MNQHTPTNDPNTRRRKGVRRDTRTREEGPRQGNGRGRKGLTMTETNSTTVATPDQVFRVMAHAMAIGLPEPTNVTVAPRWRNVLMHVAPQDWEQWRTWWEFHRAGPWSTTVGHRVAGFRHYRVSGVWRGWEITIVHLVPAPAEVAEA